MGLAGLRQRPLARRAAKRFREPREEDGNGLDSRTRPHTFGGPTAPVLMRLLSLCVAFVLLASGAFAQTIPARGADDTFDVATWNVEWFGSDSRGPSDDALQIDNVAEVVRQSGIDLWAFQEIADAGDFQALLQNLQNDGFAGEISTGGGGQKLAYIYRVGVVTPLATQTILAGNEFSFAGRLPLQMIANVSVGGDTQQIRVINIHAKCCGDTDSYNRRVAAAEVLKAYTDDQIARDRAVILLGDFNDRLNVSTNAGSLSPYRPYRGDTERYTIATFDLDRVNTPTFCSNASCTSGTTLDHILFSQDLAASYLSESGDRYFDLISSVDSYTSTTSDHLPVVARFTLAPVSNETAPEASGVTLLPAAPHPFREATALRFRLDRASDVRLSVFDALGREVFAARGAYALGEHEVALDGRALASGVYVVRLEAQGAVRAQTLVRTR